MKKYLVLIPVFFSIHICFAQIHKPIKKAEKFNNNKIIKEAPSIMSTIPLTNFRDIKTGNTCGIEWVEVIGGTYSMGCSPNQGNTCLNTSKPAHDVILSDFRLSKNEITNSQYAKFLNVQQISSTGYHNDPEYGSVLYIDLSSPNCMIRFNSSTGYFEVENTIKNYPVIEVSWYGANAYAAWKCGRLPTEAEWEYAARGGIYEGGGYKFSGSNNIDLVSWHPLNSNSPGKSNYNNINTHPVGTKQANQLGLFDMTGNVMEWCSDWYGNYSSASQINPTGPIASSTENQKVIRGGGWFSNATFSSVVQISSRYGSTQSRTGKATGFRVAYSKPIECPDLVYNGKTYKTVVIGNQCWMAENFNVETDTSVESWCYDNNPNNCNIYGRLYDWNTAVLITANVQGWHLPSNQDWETLYNELGGGNVAGTHLRTGGSSGFNALLAGYRHYIHNTFSDRNTESYYWSSTQGPEHNFSSTLIPYTFEVNLGPQLMRFNTSKQWGFSIRLVKD